VVARSHVDQLLRAGTISAERANAVRGALGRADQVRAANASAPVATELRALAAQLNEQASPLPVQTARGLWNLATALEARAGALP
jgi:hypothetical protein